MKSVQLIRSDDDDDVGYEVDDDVDDNVVDDDDDDNDDLNVGKCKLATNFSSCKSGAMAFATKEETVLLCFIFYNR